MANKPKIHLNVTTNEKMALIVSSKSQYKNHIKLDQLDITNEIFWVGVILLTPGTTIILLRTSIFLRN